MIPYNCEIYKNKQYMIANGILFKAEFDMSKYSDSDILKQFNPTNPSSTSEEIQATPSVKMQKETVIGDDVKIISYKSKDSFVLNQVIDSSKYMESAAPRLIKVVEINPEYFLVAYPYYKTSVEFETGNNNPEVDFDLLSEEDQDKIELSNKIEDTVKELARVTMYFIHENDDPRIIQEKISEYVNLCFKFTQPDQEIVSMDDISKDLEEKLKSLLSVEKENFNLNKKKKDNDEESEDSK
jgi:hypothetical protein